MLNRGYLSFITTTLIFIAGTSFCETQQVAQPPLKPEIREAWRKSMVRKALPGNGCFKAEYPGTDWQEVQCGRPSPYLNQGTPCVGVTNVGAGCDYVAQASGFDVISSAEGSFLPGSSVSGDVAFTKTSAPNIFMLQINTQSPVNSSDGAFFYTPACNGAPPVPGCSGWQQFLFSQTQRPAPVTGQQSVPGAPGTTRGVFIEYWLYNYGSPCPALPGVGTYARRPAVETVAKPWERRLRF